MSQSINYNGGIQNVWIDILDSSGNRVTSLTYLSSITITYLGPSDTSANTITLVAGTIGSAISGGFVHYDNGIYQLGLPAAAALEIGPVVVQYSGGSISTNEKLVTVIGYQDTVVSSVSNIIKLRYIIGDLDDTNYEYSDARLSQLLLVAACYVRCDISEDFEVDLEAGTITPEVSEDINNLFILKAACMLTNSEAKNAANCNVKIVDGPSTIQTTDMFKSLKLMGDSFCSDYKLAVVKYNTSNTGGCSSSTPYGGAGYCPTWFWK